MPNIIQYNALFFNNPNNLKNDSKGYDMLQHVSSRLNSLLNIVYNKVKVASDKRKKDK